MNSPLKWHNQQINKGLLESPIRRVVIKTQTIPQDAT